MKQIIIAVLLTGMAFAVCAGNRTILPGMAGRWSEDTSWREGSAPKAGDAVLIILVK